MKYMLLINLGDKVRDQANLSPDELERLGRGYGELNATPGMTPGVRLSPPDTATTVRVRDEKVLTTDGPFVETKEAIDGYCFFEGDDLDQAIEIAAKIPSTQMGGSIEIRPVVEW